MWAGSLTLATGSDRKLTCYSAEGRPVQLLEFKSDDEHEITTAVVSVCGQMVALGSFNKYFKSIF